MILTENIKKSFDGRPVLNGVDCFIEKGTTGVVVGRSGCGKSVLLKIILGILKPDAGRIVIDGVDSACLSEGERYRIRLKFGMLFQSAALFDSMTVEENVAYGLVEHTPLSPAQIHKRVRECLELVGLRGLERHRPQELSGGMRKRVGLARAIAMRPQILLFDEPTTGLDPVTADAINRLMIQLKEILKVTCVAVTHDLTSAFRVGDRILMLHEGRIHAHLTPEEFRNSQDPVIVEFMQGLEFSSGAHSVKG